MFRKRIVIEAEDQVKLKPILGIEPGVYLAFLYGMILFLALFMVFFYPGISRPGSLGVLSSEPSGAAVRVDDVTLGYTPCEVFIPKGKRTVEFILPGFTPDRQEITVRGRIFASLFLPRRLPLKGVLSAPDPAAAFAGEVSEFIRWSFAGEGTEGYQIPRTISEGAYRTGPAAAKDPRTAEAIQDILKTSLRYASTKTSLRDIVRAQFLAAAGGQSPSPLSLLRSVQEAAAHVGESPGAAPWVTEFLSPENAALCAGSRWYAENTAGTGESRIQFFDLPYQFPSRLTLEGLDFVPVNPGFLFRYGKKITMPPFFITPAPVSRAAWDAFTEENPQWAASGRDGLIEQGLAGEDYLVPPEIPGYPDPAAPGISWYAAAAYGAWLSTKLPPLLADWEVRLPTEEEWEYAAHFGKTGTSGLWEWCADPYAPLDFFPAVGAALAALEKTSPRERSLRGGAWINPVQGDIGVRGSLPPETSSPFAGFRPVIVPRSGE